MKLTTLIISALITALICQPTLAIELSDLGKADTSSTKQLKKSLSELSPIKAEDMISYTAKQLSLSESAISAGFSSLLKVAKDNLSADKFAIIGKAIPETDNYLAKAPKESKSSLNSLLSNAGDSGKKADSLHYLTNAFDKLGISSEQILPMLKTLSGYLESNGYGEAASYLQEGLSFL